MMFMLRRPHRAFQHCFRPQTSPVARRARRPTPAAGTDIPRCQSARHWSQSQTSARHGRRSSSSLRLPRTTHGTGRRPYDRSRTASSAHVPCHQRPSSGVVRTGTRAKASGRTGGKNWCMLPRLPAACRMEWCISGTKSTSPREKSAPAAFEGGHRGAKRSDHRLTGPHRPTAS